MRRVKIYWIILDEKGSRGIASSSGSGSEYGDNIIPVSQAEQGEFGANDHDGFIRFRDGKCGY